MTVRIPRYTLDGVPDAEVSVHPFATDDGLGLNLTRFRRADCDDVVLLVHGLTSSSDLFIMPEHRNLASYLLDTGSPTSGRSTSG
jgi:cholesterol oxidase